MKKMWLAAARNCSIILLALSAAFVSFGMSPLPYQTEEEIYLSERIKAKDWPAIRLYLEQTEQAGKEPLYTEILDPLISSSDDEFVWELIDAGILEKINPDHFTYLLIAAITAKQVSLGQTLLDHALAREWAPTSRDLWLVLLMTIQYSPELIDLALATGIDLNHADYTPYHPLSLALSHVPGRATSSSYADERAIAQAGTPQQRAELFWALVEHGASIDVAIERQGTSVSEAGVLGDARILDYLLAHGGDLNSGDGSALITSILYGANHLEFIPLLLERGIDVCIESSNGETAYDAALSIGELDIIRKYPQLLCKEKVHFAYAGITGDMEIMQFLLEHGADVNEPLNGNTALNFAASAGDMKTIQFLLEQGADVNEPSSGDAALGSAVLGTIDNATITIPFLLEQGADVCRRNDRGRTPYSQVMSRALRDPGYAVILRQFPQLLCKTAIPFNDAAALGDLVIMSYLLEQGGEINKADSAGEASLTYALLGLNPEVAVPWLLERGADVCLRDDIVHQTPWERAMLNAVVDPPDRANNPLLQLLKKTPNLRCPDTTGFEYAVTVGDTEWLELMIAQGMDVNAPNSVGVLPLREALHKAQTISLVKVLLEHGADTCARDVSGMTAYDTAAQQYSGELKEQLLLLLECQYP